MFYVPSLVDSSCCSHHLQDSELLVPPDVLAKPSSWCFDIVTASNTHSACFTKAYSRYAKGTGSVLSTADWVSSEVSAAYKRALLDAAVVDDSSPSKRKRFDTTEAETGRGEEIGTGTLAKGETEWQTQTATEGGEQTEKKCLSGEQVSCRLRYLAPSELLRLFGFPSPPHFSLPPALARRKAYELIGNSLSVTVAAKLVHFLMLNTAGAEARPCADI